MLFAVSAGVFAQENSVPAAPEVLRLSAADAVELAIKNNLSLQSARLDLDNKQRKSELVWNQFLPSLSATGTFARDNWATTTSPSMYMIPSESNALVTVPSVGSFYDQIYARPIPSMTLPNWHVIGNFTATLDFSFALIAGIQTIHSDYHAGLVTYEKAKLQLERDVRKMYNQILLLEESASLLRDNYENAVRQAGVAEANYNAGLVPRLSWLQAQVAVENMKPTMTETENGLRTLKATFAMNLGLPYDTVFEFEKFSAGDFSIPLDLEELISKAATGKPDILELQKNIILLQNSRKAMAMSMYTPFLRFGWTLSSTFNPMLNPFKDTWFSKDSWRGGGNFTITLGYNFNSLFPFTKEGQSLKDLDNRVQGLNIALAQVIRGTELEIFNKVNSLEKTQTSMRVQQGSVELAELSYNLTDEAYRAGLQDFQAVRSSALALEQARYQLLSQQFSYINDLIDLEYATGVPFGTLNSRF